MSAAAKTLPPLAPEALPPCGAPDPDNETRRCVKDAGHEAAGDAYHRWVLEIDMESWLPMCRLCGGVAARCPCPAFGAAGHSTVVPR